jgi:hypothetical protein
VTGLVFELQRDSLDIKESLHTVRNILEGTAGSIVASGLINQLGLFLS